MASIDEAMVKASLALEAVGVNPTDRGKKWDQAKSFRHGYGIPLSLVVSGAQQHDVKLLEPTLDNLVIERPSGKGAPRQPLCGDKAYLGQPAQELIQQRNYIPHIRQRGER